jgi:molecular chaperone DnaK
MRIGIDIGTHTARAAYVGPNGQPQLIHLPSGADSMPAMVRQTMHGLVVGEEAAQALVGNSETTVVGCTRLMGRASNIPARLVERLPFGLRDAGGEALCNLLFAEVRVSAIYGAIIAALVKAATQATGQVIDEVVLTVPASAEDRFRVQARSAAETHGLRVRRLINQPTAALLALGDIGQRVAVVSCAGGTTEVSIAERSQHGVRVLASSGDALLGGDDMAWLVAKQINRRLQREAGIDIFAVGDSHTAVQGLRHASEQAMQALSHTANTRLVLDHGAGFGRDLLIPLTSSELREWLEPVSVQIMALCKRVLQSAQLKPAQIDRVVLIGDWAFLPALAAAVAKAFRRTPAELHREHAEALAAWGAALAAEQVGGSIWDVTPYPLGINCYYGETELLSPIIRANTAIPTAPVGHPGAFTESYQTRFPDQTSVRLDVLQYRGTRNADPHGAERVTPSECEVLGSWEFRGLKPKQGQSASFSVTFAIDQDGILHLTACETDTGHTLSAQINRSIG